MSAASMRLYVVFFVAGQAVPAAADVATDGTAGPRVRLSGDFEIGADLGTRAGRNLFHSFERFSLSAGERATFSGPDQIRNVIGRVTGGAGSEIDGTLRSIIPGADFYFLNPAGVVFGPNASLDLQGSFHVSTADELRFTDGANFSATSPAASSFTVAAPEAFGFLGASPAPILVDQSVLEVPTGSALSIAGGDIDITGGPEGFIRAEAGQITLAAVGGPGEARFRSGAIDGARKADISLTDQAQLDTSGDGGGTIHIRGSSFVVGGQSFVFAENEGSLDAVGGIDVDADRVRVTGGSGLTTNVFGSGHGGTLRVSATEVRVAGDSGLTTNVFGSGHGGTLRVDAAEVRVSDGGLVGGTALDRGNAGAVQITAGALRILRGGGIVSATRSEADAGGVTVEADRLSIRGGEAEFFTGIASSAERGSSGDAGLVTVHADRMLITRGGSEHFTGILSATSPGSSGDAAIVQISSGELQILAGGAIISEALGEGHGARVTIDADHLLLHGGGSDFVTGISSSASSGSSGDAGIVQIAAAKLEILAGAQITSSTFSEGDAGRVTVEADRLSIRGVGSEFLTGIGSSAEPGSSGDAGTVQIVAGELEILEGSEIRSSTFSTGDAGTVTIDAGRLLIRGGGSEFLVGIRTGAAIGVAGDVGQGDAGSILIEAETVEIVDGGGVSSSAAGPGSAGDVILRAADRLILDEALISTATTAAGGGEIQLLVGNVIELRDSAVATSVAGGADPTAGSIIIDPTILIIDGSRIQANAPAGFGGRVTIVADNILVPNGDFEGLLARGDISASGGDPTRAGTIAVNAPDVDLSAGLVVVEGTFIDTAPLRARCGARRDIGASSFTGVGRGGLPPSPDGPLADAYLGRERGAMPGLTADAPPGQAAGSPRAWAVAAVPPCAAWPEKAPSSP